MRVTKFRKCKFDSFNDKVAAQCSIVEYKLRRLGKSCETTFKSNLSSDVIDSQNSATVNASKPFIVKLKPVCPCISCSEGVWLPDLNSPDGVSKSCDYINICPSYINYSDNLYSKNILNLKHALDKTELDGDVT